MYTNSATGKSVRGLEIPAFTNQPDARNYLYVIGGVHGDEGEGVFMANQLYKQLQIDEPQVPMIIIPLLNPDGMAAGTRVNANLVDLNRNWPVANWSPEYSAERYNPGPTPLSEPENEFLYNLFKKYLPKMIVTLHSWDKEPMLNYNAQAKLDAEFIARYNNYNTGEEVGYATPGSLGTYASEVLQCGIITYEVPIVTANLTLDDIWSQNEKALQQYFTKFVE